MRKLEKSPMSLYYLIPDNIYDAFMKKLLEGKRGDYINSVQEFLNNLGATYNGRSRSVDRLSEEIASYIFIKTGDYHGSADNKSYVITIKKNEFKRLFMEAFLNKLQQDS